MKIFKITLTFALLLTSLCSSAWAFHKCPSVNSIKENLAGKQADRMSFNDGTYTALWWNNFETAYEVWGFSISNIAASNANDVFEKIQTALTTLSGTPKPEITQSGVKCTYTIGFGYTAQASRLSM